MSMYDDSAKFFVYVCKPHAECFNLPYSVHTICMYCAFMKVYVCIYVCIYLREEGR